MYILYIRQKFCTSLSKKIGVNACFGADRKSVMMIRFEINSMSEVVEEREREKNSALRCSLFL